MGNCIKCFKLSESDEDLRPIIAKYNRYSYAYKVVCKYEPCSRVIYSSSITKPINSEFFCSEDCNLLHKQFISRSKMANDTHYVNYMDIDGHRVPY